MKFLFTKVNTVMLLEKRTPWQDTSGIVKNIQAGGMQEVICEITWGEVGENQSGGFLGNEQCAFILFLMSNKKKMCLRVFKNFWWILWIWSEIKHDIPITTCVVIPTANLWQTLGLLHILQFCPVTGQCSWQFISQNNFCNLQFFPRTLMCQLDLYF